MSGTRLADLSPSRQLMLVSTLKPVSPARTPLDDRSRHCWCETWLPLPIRMCTSCSGARALGMANISDVATLKIVVFAPIATAIDSTDAATSIGCRVSDRNE